jgi:hypothetical protein
MREKGHTLMVEASSGAAAGAESTGKALLSKADELDAQADKLQSQASALKSAGRVRRMRSRLMREESKLQVWSYAVPSHRLRRSPPACCVRILAEADEPIAAFTQPLAVPRLSVVCLLPSVMRAAHHGVQALRAHSEAVASAAQSIHRTASQSTMDRYYRQEVAQLKLVAGAKESIAALDGEAAAHRRQQEVCEASCCSS